MSSGETPTRGEGTGSPLAASEGVGDSIGPYRLLEVLGRGGFGEVWLAEQREPVRRRVAIKVLRPGMHSREVLARFEAERQALALMNHPGVAKVLDAGLIDRSRPFIVMELVPGEPITRYCDRKVLTVRERVELVVRVCLAVQHAHQKGVIHRDLKPTNILVYELDGRAEPKVIDFGIAKAIAQPLTDRTLHTGTDRFLGTPEYMSPEQAGGESADVDTRADVYSLGVILYELLTGTRPLDEHRAQDVEAMRRLIREVEPKRPSTRVSTAIAGAPVHAAPTPESSAAESARRRGVGPSQLARTLRGDLDWITMRCLEKDRARRYDSVGALADDLGRYLAGEPVVAGPPSVGYRVGKFVRRHRVGVSASVAMLALLVGGLGATGWMYRRAERERAIAQRQSERATAALDIVRGMFRSVQPSVAQGKPALVRDVMDAAAKDLAARADVEPSVESTVRAMIGEAYQELGHADLAEPQLRRALELGERTRGPRDPETMTQRHNLAAILITDMRLDEAQGVIDRAIADRAATLGPRHPDTLASKSLAITILQRRGKYAEAEPLSQQLIADQTIVSGPTSRETIDSRLSLADIYDQLGRPVESEREAADIAKVAEEALGPGDPLTLTALSIQASALETQAKDRESIAINRDILARRRRIMGDDHPHTILSMDALGEVLFRVGQRDEAIALRREAVERSKRVFGPEHASTSTHIHNLGSLLHMSNKLDEAEEMYRAAHEIARKALGETHHSTLSSLNQLGLLLLDRKRPAEALPFLEQVLAGFEKELPPDHWLLGVSRTCVGECLTDLQRYDQAEAMLKAAYDHLARAQGAGHPNTRRAAAGLAAVCDATGRAPDAGAWRAKAKPAPK